MGESTPRSKDCRRCGTEFVTVWPKQGFCSKTCAQQFRNARNNPKRYVQHQPRACAVCAAMYTPSRSDSLTCSRGCRVRLNTRRRAGLDVHTVTSCVCPGCETSFAPTRNHQVYCSDKCWHHARDRRARNSRLPTKCGDCETPIEDRGIRARYCETCHAKRRGVWAQSANSRRRARKLGVYTETVRRTEIARRDKWICQLCGKKVDRKLKHPHPLSWSIDHVVPLSLGGDHTKANCQLAHLVCNTRKNNRLNEPVQLALIG